ncbi:hypothetical protein PFNF135_03259 [Plasmodium falciparum NF135/5.C10]|uniref:Uncharacterized protein n=1 Tax=Plasmodium falciparum NF135/5.C10 TaxID=1036726 RepID=W4IFD1_PLAFA|nr:hypothetical protein PFNF135_03259 [Plasmodium falciparum NF135/5.C10]
MNLCSVGRIFLNLLSITVIILVVVLNSIIICDKRKTMDTGIYHIYRRNLYELECVEHSGLRSISKNVELKNTVDKKNNNIPFD